MRREVFARKVEIYGKEHRETLDGAERLVCSLNYADRYDEVQSILRKTIPVARRVLGDDNLTTLRLRYASVASTCNQSDVVALDDLREALRTLEETAPIARRILGGAHPLVADFERALKAVRANLSAREASPGPGSA